MDQATIAEINAIKWMHTIDLGDGVVTAGKWPRNPRIAAAFDRIGFGGKKVLDVGTCNGLWSFEAERRGASEVHSVDFLTHVGYWCAPGYRLAHRLLDSKAIYNPDVNVYDIDKLGVRDFDIVVFAGLYYHLKNPLLALARARSVLKAGGYIIVEGPVLLNQQGAVAQFLYTNYGRDRSNWWEPSEQCLREWIECSRFRILEEFPEPTPAFMSTATYKLKRLAERMLGRPEFPSRRTVVLAEAVSGTDPLYASLDPDLADAMR